MARRALHEKLLKKELVDSSAYCGFHGRVVLAVVSDGGELVEQYVRGPRRGDV